MSIPRNPDGTLRGLHPYAPTFILVMRDGRRIYHDAEKSIRTRLAIERNGVVGFYVVNRGRTIALPI